MNIKQIFVLAGVLVSAISMSTSMCIYASESEITNEVLETEHVTIENNGIERQIIQYKDREAVLDYIKKEYEDCLKYIKDKYKLNNISMSNWVKYYEELGIEDMELGLDEPFAKEISELNKILDIFENNEEKEIMEREEEGYDLAGTSYFLRSTVGIDLDEAIKYASRYATSPNKKEYKYFGSGDCTNFVSQILEAGGISQEVYDSEYSGWWHRKEKGTFGTKHKYSVSFIRAATFADYMGVSYSTDNHFDFSQEVDIGDIIGFDKGQDGDWDHMAFVTDKRDSIVNRNGKQYYDYKVAQHTSNYHKWVSDSGNGWENLEDKGYGYGIIRR